MLSIILPNYNYERYLKQRIDSILNQTYRDFELMVLDDCSTDGSVELIESYITKDKRIKFYKNGENSGSPFIQWKKGIESSQGEYIWIAEADDFADKNLLERLVAALDGNPDACIAYANSYIANGISNILREWDYSNLKYERKIFESDFVMSGIEFIQRFLMHENVIPNASAVVFRRNIYERIGGVDLSIKSCSDWLLWLKMLSLSDIVYIAEPLNYFRRHQESVISSIKPDQSGYTEQYSYLMRKSFKKWIDCNNIKLSKEAYRSNNEYISYDYGNNGLFLLRNGEFLKGWFIIMKASFYPVFQMGYIKKALKGYFR